jgi:hypothetical protein
MTVQEIISQLEKANPDDTVMVGGKSEFAIEILNSEKLVSIIPIA